MELLSLLKKPRTIIGHGGHGSYIKLAVLKLVIDKQHTYSPPLVWIYLSKRWSLGYSIPYTIATKAPQSFSLLFNVFTDLDLGLQRIRFLIIFAEDHFRKH